MQKLLFYRLFKTHDTIKAKSAFGTLSSTF